MPKRNDKYCKYLYNVYKYFTNFNVCDRGNEANSIFETCLIRKSHSTGKYSKMKVLKLNSTHVISTSHSFDILNVYFATPLHLFIQFVLMHCDSI